MNYIIRRIENRKVSTKDKEKVTFAAFLEGKDGSVLRMIQENSFEFNVADEVEIVLKKVQTTIDDFIGDKAGEIS